MPDDAWVGQHLVSDSRLDRVHQWQLGWMQIGGVSKISCQQKGLERSIGCKSAPLYTMIGVQVRDHVRRVLFDRPCPTNGRNVFFGRFVVLAADAQVARSILLYKSDMDKINALTEDKLLASGGPQSDCVAFTEFVSKNMALYELNNDVKLSTKAAATFIRGEVCCA